MMQTRSTCPYCGVGCGVLIETDGQKIVGIQGDPRHPANFGRLCAQPDKRGGFPCQYADCPYFPPPVPGHFLSIVRSIRLKAN